MTYFPIPVEQFGGLDLTNDPGEVGFSGAIDLCDVQIDRPGVVRTRDLFSSLVANTSLTAPALAGVGGDYWIASTAASVKLYLANSLVGTAVAPATYYPITAVPFGTPTTSYIYLADVSGATAIRRLTTAAVISAPAGMPTAQFLTRTSTDNRLVAAFVGSGGPGAWNPHRVQFSNAGDAETWGANNWVDLDPGDNEQIAGAATYGNSTYIFKQTKIFEFYGNSIDSSGNPIFNYRAIRNQSGISMAIAGNDGVYYVGYAQGLQSVFRVNGGQVTEVGRPIRRAISALAPAGFTPGSLSVVDLQFAGGQLRLVCHDSGAGVYCFSYDPATGQWSLMRLADSSGSVTGYGNGFKNMIVGTGGAAASVHKVDPANVSSDSFRTPTPVYQSGFENLAPPRRYIDKYGFGSSRKRIRSWRVAGTGTVTMSVAADEGALKGATSLTLGTSPAIAEARYSNAIRGAKISYKLSGVGPWAVNDLVAMLADTRQPGSDVSDG